MFDVITIGSATQDVFLTSTDFSLVRGKQFSTGVGECFAFGAKIPVRDLVFATGGGATNAAATFAHLGLKAAVLCRIGDDGAGYEVRRDLKKHRVNDRLIAIDPTRHTGYSAIILSGTGERTILTHRGASAYWDPKQMPWRKLRTRWIYLSSLAGDLKILNDIFQNAAAKNISIAWNPGGAELALGLKKLEPHLSSTSILNMNKEEGQQVLGQPKATIRTIISTLKKICPGVLLITDGRQGGYAWGNETLYRFWPTKHTPLNATGAGDAFGSGFVASYMRDQNTPRALAVGALNAGHVVTKMGAKNGILPEWPTEKLLRTVKVQKI